MKVVCSLCGREEEIAKWHQDYERLRVEHGTYVCEICSVRVRQEARKEQEPGKPL